MCHTCFDASTKEDVSSLSRFAEIVGGMDHVQFRDDYPDDAIADMKATASSCLCPVNIIETLVLAGFRVWMDPDDTVWRGFFFEPVPSALRK